MFEYLHSHDIVYRDLKARRLCLILLSQWRCCLGRTCSGNRAIASKHVVAASATSRVTGAVP
jgi:serine/threonine protein kinase